MTTVNAVHMPTNFDPTSYDYVGAYDSGDHTPGRYMGESREYTMDDGSVVVGNNWTHAYESWLRRLLYKSPTSRFGDRHACDHCGASIRYVAVMRHKPTGDHIACGEQCLDNRFGMKSKADFQRLRKAAAEVRAEHRIVGSCKRLLDAEPDLRDIIWPVPDRWNGTRAAEILHDIARKFRRYGQLSEKQISFVRKLAVQAEDELARKAKWAAERETALDAPTGRKTVEGVIVSRKWKDSRWGGGYKLMLRNDDGWRVWFSEPGKIEAEVGDRVEVTLTLKRSDDDSTFAFGKNPYGFVVTVPKVDDEAEAA